MPAYPLEEHAYDVVVVGAGGGGLRAACAASAGGLSVVCLSKVPPTRSHTIAAQGGINAALGNRMPDRWEWHMYDTIRGGDWLSDQDAVGVMCERAAAAVLELEHLGMPFTRDANGSIYQRAYGGQRTDFGKGAPAYRACAVADRTGHSLLHTFYHLALRQQVEFAVEFIVLDLVMDAQGRCRGVLAWELESGTLHLFQAHTVILATGGYGQAWAATTSSSICTGDGGGMALRAGLPLQDMEFVQFHPTSLYGTGILITEGARGEGAYLRNGLGERFMQAYAPNSMELASRDVISRAMALEIQAGRGCGPKKDHLHLCLNHLKLSLLQETLPAVLTIASTFAGIDATRDPIPVVPAVHFTMGGIASNAKCEVFGDADTPVPGLLVVGEAGCSSVHGANRLGCNALLDLAVFGKLAGERCVQDILPRQPHNNLPKTLLEPILSRFDAIRHARGDAAAGDIRHAMQLLMQRHAGIFRTQSHLEEGLSGLQQLCRTFSESLNMPDQSLRWNTALVAALEVDNLLSQARVTLSSAQFRTESRGAHWRQDFPERNDKHWLTHTLVWCDGQSNIRLGNRDVRLTGPKALHFVPERRSY